MDLERIAAPGPEDEIWKVDTSQFTEDRRCAILWINKTCFWAVAHELMSSDSSPGFGGTIKMLLIRGTVKTALPFTIGTLEDIISETKQLIWVSIEDTESMLIKRPKMLFPLGDLPSVRAISLLGGGINVCTYLTGYKTLTFARMEMELLYCAPYVCLAYSRTTLARLVLVRKDTLNSGVQAYNKMMDWTKSLTSYLDNLQHLQLEVPLCEEPHYREPKEVAESLGWSHGPSVLKRVDVLLGERWGEWPKRPARRSARK